MSYESPIELMKSAIESINYQVNKQIENEVLNAVMRVGINVDKDELLKALAYDRNQYQKGRNDRDAEIVRCNDCKYARHDDVSGGVFCTKLTEKYTTQDDKAVNEYWYCADGERW